jgi:hypothetical protein
MSVSERIHDVRKSVIGTRTLDVKNAFEIGLVCGDD